MAGSLRSYHKSALTFLFIDAFTDVMFRTNNFRKGHHFTSRKSYNNHVYGLKRSGYINIVKKQNGEKFLKLTRKGELQLLIEKSAVDINEKWDKKWRVIFFDIPKSGNKERDKLRRLLKKVGFKKLQASVYISPYSLNREAIEYLKATKLIDYIRIGRIEELDNDEELVKYYKLAKFLS